MLIVSARLHSDVDITPPQLQRCACSNVVCLVGAVLAFVLYFYGLSAVPNEPCVAFQPPAYDYRRSHFQCPKEVLEVSFSKLLLCSQVKSNKQIKFTRQWSLGERGGARQRNCGDDDQNKIWALCDVFPCPDRPIPGVWYCCCCSTTALP